MYKLDKILADGSACYNPSYMHAVAGRPDAANIGGIAELARRNCQYWMHQPANSCVQQYA
jgi:hypothetical protein